jgi:Pyridoxamine 5'-phosphate oxidase
MTLGTWGEFAEARPEMAQLLLDIMQWIPITYLATVAEDGAPRVHPVCPIIADGRMFIAVSSTSPKRLDLKRDGRYAMHALPGKWREVEGQMRGDDEFYITGRARLVEDADARRLITGTADHEIRESDWLFELEIEHAMTAYWEKVGQPGTYAVRQYWHAAPA